MQTGFSFNRDENIIALDLSLTATGVCWGMNSVGVWKPKVRGHERLAQIMGELHSALYASDADVVFIEGFSFGSKGSSLYEIGGLGYIVRHELWRGGLPYVEVPPSVLKKYATGKGTARKEEMLEAAIRRFKYAGPADNNAVDAYLLWHLAKQYVGEPVCKVPEIQAAAAQNVIVVIPPSCCSDRGDENET